MPTLTDPNFAQTAILICAHSTEGAMGIILNRSLERPSFAGILQQLDIAPLPPQREIRLCAGGPVETVRGFVVHTTDWMADGTLRVDEGLGLTTSLDILPGGGRDSSRPRSARIPGCPCPPTKPLSSPAIMKRGGAGQCRSCMSTRRCYRPSQVTPEDRRSTSDCRQDSNLKFAPLGSVPIATTRWFLIQAL
jgi:hypothetical protein